MYFRTFHTTVCHVNLSPIHIHTPNKKERKTNKYTDVWTGIFHVSELVTDSLQWQVRLS